MVGGVEVYRVKSLLDLIRFVNTGNGILPLKVHSDTLLSESQHYAVDFKDVRGQQTAKRALEVACAGGHNILMIGPPGSGKTITAKRMPTILSPFSFEISLIGGGAVPRPGEVSLAHNGVLFLDELPEFLRNVLEIVRQPLEDGTLCIARASMSLTFPARFMLAAAMNPCPCGHFNDRSRECHCTQPMIQRYMGKISGPLLDRIDIHIDVPAVNYKELRAGNEPKSSAKIRERVMRAREIQRQRFSSSRSRLYCHAQMAPRHIRTCCELSADCERRLERAMTQHGMTARAHDRILKVARTVADLEGAPAIEPKHIAEAIQYLPLDRTF